MAKSDKKKSVENDPVLVPPDGGGQGSGGERLGNGKMFFVGLALLLLLAVSVVWLLPDVRKKISSSQREAEESMSQVQEAVNPVSRENISDKHSQGAEEVAKLFAAWSSRQAAFEAENGAVWGGDEYRQAVEEAGQCERQFSQKNYGDALIACSMAISMIEQLATSKEYRLATAISAGFTLMDDGKLSQAARQFEAALAIDPANDEAQKGAQRLAVRNDVLLLVQQAREKEKDGDLQGAVHMYQQAVALDADFQPAGLALSKALQTIAEHGFQQAVGRALASLADGNLEAAGIALRKAKGIRADDPLLVDLAAQISSKELAAKLATLREKSLTLENQEKWQQAVDMCQQAVSLSSTAAFAVACQERAQRRLHLDNRLQSILDQPERLFDKGPLLAAKEIRIVAMTISAPGPRLSGQLQQLAALIDLAEAEVPVMILSDTFTDIVIYHVGQLGRFAEKKLVLPTGNYTVVGSRRGFRDVRQTLKVRPGAELVFTVRCEEPI